MVNMGRYNLGRKVGGISLGGVRTANLGVSADHANSRMDLIREEMRRNTMPQSATNGAPVVENYRLISHRANVMLPRGSDSRHIRQNRVEQIRHHIANDKIKVDRPLG